MKHCLARSLSVGCCVLVVPAMSWADWKVDSGWSQLAAELGPAMPTGAGVPVTQVEANSLSAPPNYLPQAGGPSAFAGTGVHAGRTFFPQSGTGTAFGHAASVASFFYANGTGAAPGVSQVHGFTAVDYVVNRLFAVGGPAVLPGRVHNHSWVGDFADPATDVLAIRRLDFMVARDQAVVVAGLRNDSVMAGLLGNTYHGLTVGLRSGTHSVGGSNRDGNGRMKPDLVVNAELTSYATPVVAGLAALLLQEAQASLDPDAGRPEVIKALLLAGASKEALPAWRRVADDRPYDATFGAGEANLRQAWQVQKAGRKAPSMSVEVGGSGWSYEAWAGGSRWYFFSVPPGGMARVFSAALTWHRAIDLNAGTASLTQMDLRLHAANGFGVVGAPVAASLSAIDNVEHLFLRHLPAGQYALEVSGVGPAVPYALAWRQEVGTGPQVTLRKVGGVGWTLEGADLDPWTTYTIESRPLAEAGSAWRSEASFRTGDSVPAFQHQWQVDPPAEPGRIYRLRWTSVR